MTQPGPYAFRGVLGALLIIAAGIALTSFGSRTTLGSGTTVESGAFRTTAVLSGTRHRSTATDFRGGEATAVMGGVNLDLRDATMGTNEAVIDIFAVMGGVDIRVPEDWSVEVRLTPVLGGVENRTRQPKGESSKRLILQGTTIMGGVDIRN
jgi:predicted membrane protein